MERPEKEIEGIIRTLCMGTPIQQARVINDVFESDVAFQHPFCRVPGFLNPPYGLFPNLSSRRVLHLIYQWYRWLSPSVKVDFHAVAYDKASETLFVDLDQAVKFWFFPFGSSVRLTTVIHLVAKEKKPLVNGYADGHGKEVVLAQPEAKHLYYIKEQDDQYQVNDFVKFICPCVGPIIIKLMQLWSTVLCLAACFLAMQICPWVDDFDAYKKEGRGKFSWGRNVYDVKLLDPAPRDECPLPEEKESKKIFELQDNFEDEDPPKEIRRSKIVTFGVPVKAPPPATPLVVDTEADMYDNDGLYD